MQSFVILARQNILVYTHVNRWLKNDQIKQDFSIFQRDVAMKMMYAAKPIQGNDFF